MRRILGGALPAAWFAVSTLVVGCNGDDVAAPADASSDGAQTDSAVPDGGGRDSTLPDGGSVPDGAANEAGSEGGGTNGGGSGDGGLDGGMGPVDGSDAGDGGGPLELTVFAKQLIDTQTSNSTLPTTTEDKTFIDTPPPGIFPPSFFP